jgi:hypothetical protein
VWSGRPQRYRESRGKLQAALQDFSSSTPEQQHFVLTLGDIIDGYEANPQKTSADLQDIAGMFDSMLAGRPVYHVLGNHCLAASRQDLLQVGKAMSIRMNGYEQRNCMLASTMPRHAMRSLATSRPANAAQLYCHDTPLDPDMPSRAVPW